MSTTSSSGAATAAAAAALAALKPYLSTPTTFPVTTPLTARPSSGLKVAQLQFGTPVGALVAQVLTAAAATAGVQMLTVKAGATASDVQSAMQTIIADKPDLVVLPASEPSLFAAQLKQLVSSGTIVTSVGIMNPSSYGIQGPVFDQRMAQLNGKLLADWVVAREGAGTKAVFYETPELSFSSTERDAFKAELSTTCPSCSVRLHTISATTVGTTAPQDVVSDLQSHTDTGVAVFATSDALNGVPPALKVAGISVPLIGFGPDPVSLQYVKDGSVQALLSFDVGTTEWMAFDMGLRLIQHQPLTAAEQAGLPPLQLIEKGTVPADISKGYSAFPDFVQRFAKVWQVG